VEQLRLEQIGNLEQRLRRGTTRRRREQRAARGTASPTPSRRQTHTLSCAQRGQPGRRRGQSAARDTSSLYPSTGANARDGGRATKRRRAQSERLGATRGATRDAVRAGLCSRRPRVGPGDWSTGGLGSRVAPFPSSRCSYPTTIQEVPVCGSWPPKPRGPSPSQNPPPHTARGAWAASRPQPAAEWHPWRPGHPPQRPARRPQRCHHPRPSRPPLQSPCGNRGQEDEQQQHRKRRRRRRRRQQQQER
jgi:hypothetical protein